MSSNARISIALVTRNRPDSLRRCLESVRSQCTQPYEVVVSDDSDEATAADVQKVASAYGTRYHAGPRRGLYANRNAAALACRGTHVRTMDDDHLLPSGHMSRCLDAVQSDPRSIWTTGEHGIFRGEAFPPAHHASQLHPAGVGGPVNDPDDNWAIADGSTIYPHEVFSRGLRMMEHCAGYGSSYLEFGAYLYQRGYRSRCVPEAMVEHHTETYEPHRGCPECMLFASASFNLYFRPSRHRFLRHLAPLMARHPVLLSRLPDILRKVRGRWACAVTTPAP